MKFRHVAASTVLSVGMIFGSAPSSGGCGQCGGACNHVVMPENEGMDFLPPLLILDRTSEVVIISGIAFMDAMDAISDMAGWCVHSIYWILDRLRQSRHSLDRYLLTGYWQELDYCPQCRDQKASEAAKRVVVSTPHRAFAMLLAWLKDQRISHETVRFYYKGMNTSFSVLKLLNPALSSEYQCHAAGYPIDYLSRVINSFTETVPYQAMILADNQFGHMIGIIHTGEQRFSVYFASINQRVTVKSIEALEKAIVGFYRSVRSLWSPERKANIILIGLER